MDESQSGGRITRTAVEGSPVRRGARLLRTVRGVRGAREWAGWLLVAAGAVLCVLGWYGVSGERFVEQQIPYLASSTIPGAALIVAGTVLVALRPDGPSGRGDLTDRRMEQLYALLVEPDEPGPAAGRRAAGDGWLAVPGGTHYHRPDCPLVAGKAQAAPVDARTVRARGLTACPVCEPPAESDGPTARSGEPGTDSGETPTGSGETPTDSGGPTRPGESDPPSG